jgi:adenylyltransferase/sulfurtransferase
MDVAFREDQLIIEEICGRERGRRTYTVTPPSQLIKPINVAEIVNNAESLGYHVKIRGRFGITATSTESDRLSISFLTSGAATIVGAKDQEDALYIYRAFAKKLK